MKRRVTPERQQVEAALRHSEEKYRTLVEQAFVGIFVADMQNQNRLLEANPHVCQLLGYTREELLGRPFTDFALPEEQPQITEDFRRLKAGETVHVERQVRRKDGSIFMAEVSARLLPEGQVLAMASDVSDRKRAEEAIRRVNRALRVRSAVGQQLVRATDEADLLAHITRLIVNEGGYRFTWVGYAEQDAEKTVRPVVHAGLEEGYLREVRVTWGDEPRGRGPAGTAIRTGRLAVVRQVHTDPSFLPWRVEATRRGYASVIALPLRAEEQVLGALVIYASEPDAFNAEETSLLSALAQDVSFGIKSLRNEVERQRAEAAQEASAARYRLLFEANPQPSWVYDLQSLAFLAVNEAAVAHYGYSRDEFLTMTIKDIRPAEDVPALLETVAHTTPGLYQSGVWRHRKRNGDIISVAITSHALEWAGRPARLVSVSDITVRQKAEEALRQSEENFRILFEQAVDGMFLMDRQGRFLDANPAGCQVAGYSKEEFLGRYIGDLIAPEELPLVGPTMAEVFAGNTVHNEWRCLRKDGSRFLGELTAKLLPDGRIQATLRDITQRKKTEADLRELSGRLLHLQEDERRRIARELHDTTGQNLTALTMRLSALKAAVPRTNEAAAKALDDALQLASQSMQEVRTFSYLLHPPVLDELGLTNALADYGTGFQQRSGIKVELDLPTEIGPLPREVEMTLFRVVQEGLGNIHRHSGSRAAAIRLWQEEKELWLEVVDNGRGIPTDRLHELESPSARIGVGIAGMRERVRQLGGRLAIHSSARGTTIQIIMPLSG